MPLFDHILTFSPGTAKTCSKTDGLIHRNPTRHPAHARCREQHTACGEPSSKGSGTSARVTSLSSSTTSRSVGRPSAPRSVTTSRIAASGPIDRAFAALFERENDAPQG